MSGLYFKGAFSLKALIRCTLKYLSQNRIQIQSFGLGFFFIIWGK